MLQEKINNWTNYCMSHNEEMDAPQWLQDASAAVNREIQRRYKSGT
jgi:hypothetical protein